MITRRGGLRGIVAGFAPWIAYWALSAAGLRSLAMTAAFGAALGVCGWQLRRGRPRPIELVAAAFFGANVVGGHLVGATLPETYAAVLVSAALAAMSWATLLAGAPFTAEYAREQWPREYWQAPLFRRINARLTGVWGLIFTINAGLAAGAIMRPGARLWLVGVLPQVGIGTGIALSIIVPRWYPPRWAAREITRREPYDWSAPAFGRREAAGAAHPDVIVIGAGIGGLTAAALLADRGARVLVIEQHYLPGGFCTSWPRVVRRGDERLRYVFDAGVHDVSGLGPRGPVRHLLRQLDLEDRIEWRRMRHEYILPSLRLKIPDGAADLIATLADRFPAERAALGQFFAEMEAVYRDLYADAHLTGGVPCPPRTVAQMLAYPVLHPYAFRWMEVPFGKMLDMYFREPRLKALLSILSGYLSDDPRTLTAVQMAPIFGYYFDGGYYPVGGSQAFADALVRAIRDRGGEVRLRTSVRRILVEKGRAAGVESAEGRVDRAGAIVANADARRTFLELVGREHLPADFLARVEGLQPSTSAFAVFLGLDCVPDIEPITIASAEGHGLAMAVPSKVDASLAPPGHSAVTLLTLMPPHATGEWDRKAPGYTGLKRRAGDALIARAAHVIPGLRRHIVYRQDGTPATFARYAWTTGGAIYGPATGPWRPPAKSPIEGLALAGAGVFPGAGVEAVVISGTLAADALCRGRARESTVLGPGATPAALIPA